MRQKSINIACHGKFHSYNLALQMQRRQSLNLLYTGYPRFLVRKDQIADAHIATLGSVEVISRLNRLLKLMPRVTLRRHMLDRFDRWVARNLADEGSLFIGWASSSLEAIRRAKSFGQKTIIVRGSTHIAHQQHILEEEYQKFSLKFFSDEHLVQKEIIEYQEADFIQTNSEFAAQTFLDQGFSKDKIIMVNTGVATDKFINLKKGNENAFVRGKEPLRVIYVGALSIRKGVKYLCESVKQFSARDVTLTLIGPMLDEFKPIFDSCKADNINWVGAVRQDQLAQYYRSHHLFVMPSLEEGLAMVIAQALASGLPVICTEGSGGSDLLKHQPLGGWVVPSASAELISGVLMSILADREDLRFRVQSLLDVDRYKFSWDCYGDELSEIYANIMR